MYAFPLKSVMALGRARLGFAGSKGSSAEPDGMGTLEKDGALGFPPQAASTARMGMMRFIGGCLLKPDARDHRDRAPRQRVLEEVLEGLVVEEVLDFEVEPERPGGAGAGAGVEDELRGQAGRAVVVSRRRRGEAALGIAFEAVAAEREAQAQLVRRAVGELR